MQTNFVRELNVTLSAVRPDLVIEDEKVWENEKIHGEFKIEVALFDKNHV